MNSTPNTHSPGVSITGAVVAASTSTSCAKVVSARIPTPCSRPRFEQAAPEADEAVWSQLERMLLAREAAKALHPSRFQ